MAVNKVVLNGQTLLDLSNDTVTSESLVIGRTAHDKSGNIIKGKAVPLITRTDEDNDAGGVTVILTRNT